MIKYFSFLFLLLTTLLPGQASSTNLVQDGANVLSSQTFDQLLQLTYDVEQKTTAQIMVLTVPSLEGNDVDYYAREIFNQVGIGRADTHNGVLFLIAPNERRTRIEVGYGLESLLTDSLSGEILDTYVIPHFKQNDMEGGIVAGAHEIARILLLYPDAAKGVPGSAPNYVRTVGRDFSNAIYLFGGTGLLILVSYFIVKRRKSYPVVLLFILVALVLAALAAAFMAFSALPSKEDLPFPSMIAATLSVVVTGIMNLRQFRRFRPRYCDSCSGPLQLLSESDDDKHLNEVQRLEERLGAVDYDVWHCPACLKADTERYVSMFSGFGACPKCKAHTWKETSTTLVHATTTSTGKERVDGKCMSCHHKSSEIRTIPKVSSSSSSGSSGGSSGGGSSGGGGASRSW